MALFFTNLGSALGNAIAASAGGPQIPAGARRHTQAQGCTPCAARAQAADAQRAAMQAWRAPAVPVFGRRGR
jgi:hypothetical protein